MKHIQYTWTELMHDCEMIAKALVNRPEQYKIKWIYGPPRGGCIFAVILSHKLNAKYLTTLKEKHNPLNTCIIDDVSDTGATLKKLVGKKPYVTATAFIKPQTVYIPNIYCRTVSNKTWICYPWEKY